MYGRSSPDTAFGLRWHVWHSFQLPSRGDGQVQYHGPSDADFSWVEIIYSSPLVGSPKGCISDRSCSGHAHGPGEWSV
jgi:hypothetical protein